jgi:small GTP-binding protein
VDQPRPSDAPVEPTPAADRERLAAALAAVLAIAEGVVGDRAWDDLAAAAARLRRGRFNLVVLGAFKRGKSTLLNALLGREVLPTGVLPLTAAMIVVGYGEPERVRVTFLDGRHEEHPLPALARFVTEADNPRNARGIRAVEVILLHDLLAGGLQVVDTPGVASLHEHNTQGAYAALGQVDAALCVLAADQPVAEAELELFREAGRRAGAFLFVVNKADVLSEADRRLMLDFVRGSLRDAGLMASGDDVLAVSARDGTGIDALRGRLVGLVDGERDSVLASSVARTGGRVAAEAARLLALEARALELPLDELDRRARRLEARLDELEAARADADDVLRRRATRLLDERVNEPLLAYAREHRAELEQALDAEVRRLRGGPRALAAALDAWIDATVRAIFARRAEELEGEVSSGVQALARSHADRVGDLLAQLHEAAADALGEAAPLTVPDLAVREPSRFTFKLHDPEHLVDRLAATARAMAPGAVGRRLVVRAARERLLAMADRHAGRLRSELAERVTAAVELYARELGEAVALARLDVEAAIARAREQCREGAEAVEQRVATLRSRATEAERLAEGLNGRPP